MPHEFGAPHTDNDPNARRIRRPSNAVRGGGNLTSPSPAPIGRLSNAPARPQLPANPRAGVLSQQPRRSRNIAQAAGGGRDFRAGNPNSPLQRPFQALDRIAGQAGEVAGQLGEGLTTPSATANTLGRGFQRLASGEASGSDFGRELGELGGEAVRGGFQSAVRGAGALRRGASNVLSGVFEGLGLPTDLLEENSALSRAGEFFSGRSGADGPPRPGADGPPSDIAAENVPDPSDGLTPRQRVDLTFRGPGQPADLTNEINALPVSETARRIEERTGGGPGGDVERIGPDPTTAIRGTSVSQTRGGQDQGGNFPDAVLTEGFEFPAGTTDAELRDPERLQQLVARNSLAQSLRQVPAPGEAGIPQEQQARLLAAFDKDAAAESGQTTRSREELASLERRAAQANALAKQFGFTGKGGKGSTAKVLEVSRGKTTAGADLGSDAFLIFQDAQGNFQKQKLPSNRPRDERNTDENFQRRKAEFLELNEDASEDEASEASRFFIDFGHFPEGRQLR